MCLRASIVLWAPAFTVPGEHGKTPCMPLGINSMAGTDVCYTRRRRRNLPRASDINQYCGRLLSSLYPPAWETRLSSICTLSPSLVRPSPSSIKGDALSPNKKIDQFTYIDSPSVTLDALKLYRAHARTLST